MNNNDKSADYREGFVAGGVYQNNISYERGYHAGAHAAFQCMKQSQEILIDLMREATEQDLESLE